MYSYCVLCYNLMQSYVLLNIMAKLYNLYITYAFVLLTLRRVKGFIRLIEHSMTGSNGLKRISLLKHGRDLKFYAFKKTK